jgi:hypothetical protein
MWSSDQWFAELSAEEKLLFVYLFSNERASVSGLYESPIRVMAFETSLGEKYAEVPGLIFPEGDEPYPGRCRICAQL